MFEEPPIQPDDTRPTVTVPGVDADGEPRVVGLISLLGALGFAAATIILLLSNNGGTPTPVQDNGQTVAEVLATDTAVPTRDGAMTVSVSVGCTIRQPRDVTAVEALLERADQALLQSKASGRNRVRMTN